LLVVACGGSDSGDDAEATPTASLTIMARDLKFDKRRLTAVANSSVSLHFDNRDNGVPHNVAVYRDRSAKESIFVGETFSGNASRDYSFQTPGPGDYFFRCDVHPDTMTGTFAVR
jgi:plastocyanin